MGKQNKEKDDPNLVQLKKGIDLLAAHDVFGNFVLRKTRIAGRNELGKKTPASSYADGTILVNKNVCLSPKQWSYAIAHCILHNCFGHYDEDKVPGYYKYDEKGNKTKRVSFNAKLWNIACDIYVDRFLHDIRLGEPVNQSPVGIIPLNIMEDEQKIYDYLIRENWDENTNMYGVGALNSMDMVGLDKPIVYKKNIWGVQEHNEFASDFAYYLAKSVSKAIDYVADHEDENSFGRKNSGLVYKYLPASGSYCGVF